MKRSLTCATLLAFILAASLAFAQGLPTASPEEVGLSSARLARVTELVKAEIAKGRYPGAVALVARRGKVAYFEALGQRDPQTGAPMTKDAIFRLYSMTKPFTSVAAMMLVEDGKILLERSRSPSTSRSCKGLQVSVPRVRPRDRQGVLRAGAGRARDDRSRICCATPPGSSTASFTSHAGVKEAYAKEGVDWDERDAGRADRAPRECAARAPAGIGLGVQPLDRRAGACGRSGERRHPRRSSSRSASSPRSG